MFMTVWKHESYSEKQPYRTGPGISSSPPHQQPTQNVSPSRLLITKCVVPGQIPWMTPFEINSCSGLLQNI